MKKRRIAAVIALLGAGALAVVSPPAEAQWAVIDVANLAQNILQAARMLEEINNQVTQIQQFVQMLEYQARNVTTLGLDTTPQIEGAITRVTGLMNRAQGLVYDVAQIEQAFARYYPATYDGQTTDAQLVADARTRWENSVASFRQAMLIESQIVAGIDGDRAQTAALIGQSQGAVGILQATQAGNQLLALHAEQMAGLQAMLAAQGRAQAAEQARKAAAEEQAREQLRRFLEPGAGYTPEPVRMFHN